MVVFLPLVSGSVDPHIFTDPNPDPGSQNLADPTDPDPKHCNACKLYKVKNCTEYTVHCVMCKSIFIVAPDYK